MANISFDSRVNNIPEQSRRIKREKKTIEKMLLIYCRMNHNPAEKLCKDCSELQEYAFKSLLNCPYEGDKPVCSNCTIHCYKNDMRQKIKKVMGFSGPRMLFRHPYLAVRHLINEKLI